MPKRTTDLTAPYQSIRNASYLTGLSQGSIRAGCKNGSIPHAKVGCEYCVNVPLLLEILEKQSKANLNPDTKKVLTDVATVGEGKGKSISTMEIIPQARTAVNMES